MSKLELALFEWPASTGGPRLLGRLSDPDLIDAARDRLAVEHIRHLRILRPPAPAPQPPTTAEEP